MYKYGKVAGENSAGCSLRITEFLSTCFQKIEDLGASSIHCYI